MGEKSARGFDDGGPSQLRGFYDYARIAITLEGDGSMRYFYPVGENRVTS